LLSVHFGLTYGVMMEIVWPERISSRYLFKKMIGKGGMGDVFLVEDTRMGRDVVLKAIRPELVESDEVRKRIERECKMHAAIPIHPHIVVLHEKEVTDDSNIFLVMEYVAGKNLSEIIASEKRAKQEIPVEKTISIIRQILNALCSIHEKGIIHRDITPSNIIVGDWDTSNPIAKLLDFGIARDVLDDDNLTKLTMLDTGGPGAPAYMAPERIDSKTFGDICAATDLYSVGIILYELLRLEPPFHGTLTEMFSGHLTSEPNYKGIKLLPESLQVILNKALEKNPADRYQNAQQFADDLQTVSCLDVDKTLLHIPADLAKNEGKTLLKTPIFTTSSIQKKGKRKDLLWGVCGLFLVVIISSYFIFAKGKKDHEDSNPIKIEKEKDLAKKTVIEFQSTEKVNPYKVQQELNKEKPAIVSKDDGMKEEESSAQKAFEAKMAEKKKKKEEIQKRLDQEKTNKDKKEQPPPLDKPKKNQNKPKTNKEKYILIPTR